MANPEHLAILNEGVEVWNRWREENPKMRPDLSDAELYGEDFSNINLREADLQRADLRDAFLDRAILHRANLQYGWLQSAFLEFADCREANFSESNLQYANLNGTNLNRANLHRADLRIADLNDTSLRDANLSEANLSIPDLSWVGDLDISILDVSDINHGARLNRADLTRANLAGANFTSTELLETTLNGTDLANVNFSRASIGFTVFAQVSLQNVKGIESVYHRGPSTIGVDTLFRSKGQIPDIFLQGCGLSDLEIEYAKLFRPGLTRQEFSDITNRLQKLRSGKAIQYYSCFISYSSKDEAFAQRLHTDLQHNGVRCWFAPKDMKIGDKIRSAIDQSIRLHDKLLIILSENSLNSVWVETEVEKAFEEERQRGQTVLFPVRLDQAVMETDRPWASEIRRTRHIGDFSRWKDQDAYQSTFERLLRDLKAES